MKVNGGKGEIMRGEQKSPPLMGDFFLLGLILEEEEEEYINDT